MSDMRIIVYTVRTPFAVTVWATREQAIAQKHRLADFATSVEVEPHVVDIAGAEMRGRREAH